MKLIIDTNILISSLLKDSKTREILLNETFDYYLPEIVMSEINKYLPYISQKSKLSEEEIKNLLNTLLENIYLVPVYEYEEKLNTGKEIMKDIDEKDSQFMALALSIENDGIWTNDKHFNKQDKIHIYKTIDILKRLEKSSEQDTK